MSFSKDYCIEASSSDNMRALRYAKKRIPGVWFTATGHDGVTGTYNLSGEREEVESFQRVVIAFVKRQGPETKSPPIRAEAPRPRPRPRHRKEEKVTHSPPRSPPTGAGQGGWVWVESPSKSEHVRVHKGGKKKTHPKQEHTPQDYEKWISGAGGAELLASFAKFLRSQEVDGTPPKHGAVAGKGKRKTPPAKYTPKHEGGAAGKGRKPPAKKYKPPVERQDAPRGKGPRRRTRVDTNSSRRHARVAGDEYVFENPHQKGSKPYKQWRRDWAKTDE